RERHPDLNPLCAGGLSLGEWTALHAAGALSFEDTLRVLEARGRFMQEACESRDGAMVSVIGLGPDVLQAICAETGVEIANLNSPQQTVLSGERGKIEAAARKAEAAGAKRAVMLKVAGAFHSSLMEPAAERLRTFLEGVDIREPAMAVAANATGGGHGGPNAIREAMVRQVCASVQWVSCVEWMKTRGATTYIECGPGRVLTGLIKRIDRSAGLHNIQDFATLEAVNGCI
ncbi:MAG: ACP S-malonyltransferase, partial [Lentisphaerae bacterium]|nr:ACP S-malonyltransferase [Lentisphaerota bacterium]